MLFIFACCCFQNFVQQVDMVVEVTQLKFVVYKGTSGTSTI